MNRHEAAFTAVIMSIPLLIDMVTEGKATARDGLVALIEGATHILEKVDKELAEAESAPTAEGVQ